jgi:hypothetical protein
MSRSSPSARYATAIALAGLWIGAPAAAAPDAVSIRATEPLIQHLREESSASLVPAASQGKATARQARMRRCMQSWDPATQMSKREWKQSCQRVIIQQPGMFGPDPL